MMRIRILILAVGMAVAVTAWGQCADISGQLMAADSIGRAEVIRQVLAGISDADSLAAFVDDACQTFYEPTSPVADDEIFLAVADGLLADTLLPDGDRTRLEYMKEQAMLNRVGHRAADFEIRRLNGATECLSELVKSNRVTILMFYDPDCTDCAELEHRLADGLPDDTGVVMVSPYGEQDGLWARHAATMPDDWVVGLPVDDDFEESGLYDIRATPTVLLLDSEMKVLSKKIDSVDGIIVD